MRRISSLHSKKAESDNITIFFFTILVLVGFFYIANWFLGGTLTEIAGGMFKETVSFFKNPIDHFLGEPKELPAQCAEPFKCKEPLNEETCPDIELAEYNKMCDVD